MNGERKKEKSQGLKYFLAWVVDKANNLRVTEEEEIGLDLFYQEYLWKNPVLD